MSEVKKPMTGLFRDNPKTPEGKYLVKRRDGTVPEWPSFVIGAADPFVIDALRAYAAAVRRVCIMDEPKATSLGVSLEFANRIDRLADEFSSWWLSHKEGDPGMGPHRKDDPATIEEMRKGKSA